MTTAYWMFAVGDRWRPGGLQRMHPPRPRPRPHGPVLHHNTWRQDGRHHPPGRSQRDDGHPAVTVADGDGDLVYALGQQPLSDVIGQVEQGHDLGAPAMVEVEAFLVADAHPRPVQHSVQQFPADPTLQAG